MWLKALPIGLSQFQQGHHPTQCPPSPGGSGSSRGTSKTKACLEARPPAWRLSPPWWLACSTGLQPWLRHPCLYSVQASRLFAHPNPTSLHPPTPSPISSLPAVSVFLGISVACLSLCHPAPPPKVFQALSQPLHPQAPSPSQSLVFRKPPSLPSSLPSLAGGGVAAGAHFLSSRLNILMQSHYSPGVQAGQASPLLVCHPE